uniref:Uncharacterized protein n=1 Tax=Ditylenchus dipsaci TaxID=166011 RepID=A0A915DEI2_9BILA
MTFELCLLLPEARRHHPHYLATFIVFWLVCLVLKSRAGKSTMIQNMTLILSTSILSAIFLVTAALENNPHDFTPLSNLPEPSPINLDPLNGHTLTGKHLQTSDSHAPRSPFNSPAFSHYPSFDASATNPESDGFSGDFSPSMGPFQKYFTGSQPSADPFSAAGGSFGGPAGPGGRPGQGGPVGPRGAPPAGPRGGFGGQQQQFGGGFGQRNGAQPQFGQQFQGGAPGGSGGRPGGSLFGGQRQTGFGGQGSFGSQGGFGGQGGFGNQGFGGPGFGYGGNQQQQQQAPQQMQQRPGVGFGFF